MSALSSTRGLTSNIDDDFDEEMVVDGEDEAIYARAYDRFMTVQTAAPPVTPSTTEPAAPKVAENQARFPTPASPAKPSPAKPSPAKPPVDNEEKKVWAGTIKGLRVTVSKSMIYEAHVQTKL